MYTVYVLYSEKFRRHYTGFTSHFEGHEIARYPEKEGMEKLDSLCYDSLIPIFGSEAVSSAHLF